MKYTLTDIEEQKLAEVDRLKITDETIWTVEVAGKKQRKTKTKINFVDNNLEVQVGAKRSTFFATTPKIGETFQVATALGSIGFVLKRGTSSEAGGGGAKHKVIKSSIPGKIIKVLCKPDQKVEQGTPLIVLEAMKMENEIRAPRAGVIEEIKVEVGQSIESGAILVKLGSES